MKELLTALRAQLLANVVMVDALLQGIAQAEAAADAKAAVEIRCPHPADDRVKIDIMGDPGRWMCTRCGTVVGGRDKAAAETPPPEKED